MSSVSSSAKKGLVAGAFSLALAGLISKILGVIYNVPFQNIAGDTALAYYNAAYNYYVLLLQVCTAGIPLALSKMISERNAVRDFAGADQIYRVGARYLSLMGLFFFVVMFAGGGLLADAMDMSEASTSMRALSFALLIVPVMAAMRGFLQGHQSMDISGNSQVIEQFVRVVFSLSAVLLIVKVWHAGAKYSAAVATFGAVLGALASLFFLARHVVTVRRENRKKYRNPATDRSQDVFRNILLVSIPISLSSLVLPLSQVVDNNTIVRLLTAAHNLGLTHDAAVAQFGIFTGRALRLVALPLSLATAIGLSLMPAISEAISARNQKLTNERTLMAYRLTGFFSFPIAIGVFLLGKQIDIALFADKQGADTIATVGFMAIFSSYEMVTTYILQARGFMYTPIKSMFAGLLFKLILNLMLVPNYGIFGAAIASVLGYVLSSALNFWALKRKGGTPLPLLDLFGKPLVSSVVMGLVILLLTWIPVNFFFPWSDRMANLLFVILCGAVGGIVFVALMILQKGLSRDEMKRIPLLKKLIR
ncbi:MAG: putative polysaccharide biosynthesis protein [Tumebacillaceae bacterium]